MTDRYFVQFDTRGDRSDHGWRDIDADQRRTHLNNPPDGFPAAERAFALLERRAKHTGLTPSNYRVVQRVVTSTDVVVEPPVLDPGVLGAHVFDRDGDLWARGDGDAWLCLSHMTRSDDDFVSRSWARLVEVHGPIKAAA